MKVDNSRPWIEDTVKSAKLGEVIEAIIELKKDNSIDQENLNARLEEVEVNVDTQLKNAKQRVLDEINAHKEKLGNKAHGETKETIGLGKKENLAEGKVNDVLNGEYRHEWVTPQILSLMIEQSLGTSTDTYMKSGMLPLSSGRLLGRSLVNQIYYGDELNLPERTASGQVSYLFATEENYLLFSELGQGRIIDFNKDGFNYPKGSTFITMRNDNIHIDKGQAIAISDLTTLDKTSSNFTGLEWGFGDYHGNFHDSNFYPTVDTSNDDRNTGVQEVEVALFDPTIVYNPNGQIYLKNFNSVKHNFNELTVNQDGKYPFNDSVFLSSNDFMCHIANTRIVKQNDVWCISFDFLSGEVGIPDWYPEIVSSKTDKILSKKGVYNVKQTSIFSITGFDDVNVTIKAPGDLPWGVENRQNYHYSNFIGGSSYSSIYIPINSIINGFNKLPENDQLTVINAIDLELLIRITMAWNNEHTKTGLLRIPFYYIIPNSEASWHHYIDIQFNFVFEDNINKLYLSAFNFDATKRPTINSDFTLTVNDGSYFYAWTTDVNENPFHPKVFRGCFLETGGHLCAYVAGHREYICSYKHEITSVRDWIVNNRIPTLNEEKVRIRDVGMFPANKLYGDNIRLIPLIAESDKITYLTRRRNKKEKYDYGVFSINPTTFNLANGTVNDATEVTWLNKKTSKNIPILVDNSNLNVSGINTTGLVFSETNGFIGYQNHGFKETGFEPSGVTEIDNALYQQILTHAGINDAYPILFYYEQVLYWAIVSKTGTKNSKGYDSCIGGVRVDTYFDGKTYVIRSLPNMTLNARWAVMFNEFPNGKIHGRESGSFDDVFIINKSGADKTSRVFINYPNLEGRYYSFEIEDDNLGYKYPTAFNPTKIDLKKESGFGEYSPYVFFSTYFTPFMMGTKLYVPDHNDVFKLTQYTSQGQELIQNYYMGWGTTFPLYVTGESITINGRSMLLDSCITLPVEGHNHLGKIFISYYDEIFHVYSTNENTLYYPIEPNNTILFAGFWEKIETGYMFSYHLPIGYSDKENQDFVNSLLPIIDNKQMSTDSMGSTFPVSLGKLSGKPRQYYFKKKI